MRPSLASESDARASDHRLDAHLRRALDEPEAAEQAAQRLVRAALAASEPSAVPPRRHRWRLAAAAGGIAAAALLVFRPGPDELPSPVPDPAGRTTLSVASPSRPVVLEISNANGPVTVSAAGSKVVFLPPMSSSTRPASTRSPSTVPLPGGAS